MIEQETKKHPLIELEYAEIQQAALVANQRYLECVKSNKKSVAGETMHDHLTRHIAGAMAEMAFAKYKGLYWSKGGPGLSDVGEFEVRVTHIRRGKLILRSHDKRDATFYLLVGEHGKYKIIGSIKGSDGMQDCFVDPLDENRKPAWAVPQDKLIQEIG